MMDRNMEEKIEKLVSELTLEEKIGMIHGDGLFRTKGVERLGIPAVTMSDGPMGVRNEFENARWVAVGNSDDYVTYLPSNSALAATWNRQLAYEAGKVLGEEARARGKDVILAPGINIKRSTLCGRSFEYMSEDPYLTGELAVPLIQGIQTADTAACVKHFALNNQETERLWVEVEVSERALREIYLPAFEKAVKAGKPYSLMGAYNRYKNEHCCESKRLLNGILRKEWGYDGMVVSDWGAVHNTKEAAESGLDIEMSVENNFDEYCMAMPLKEAVENGEIEEAFLDEKVKNILRMLFRLHKMGDEKRKPGAYNTPEHRMTALEAARESVVLLKNDVGKLPLCAEKTKKVLVIGDNGNRLHSNGGGSAEIKALYEISPLMGIRKLLGGNAEIVFAEGYFADDMKSVEDSVNWQADSLENGGGSTGILRNEDAALLEKQARLREEALKLAADESFDMVIFVGGQNHLQDLEGHDRPDMKLPYGQDVLIEDLLSVRPDTVVVIASGSPVEMPWVDKAASLVWHWYAGMEGGTALAEVLFGKINPSGRLPETFPIVYTDCPAHCVGEFPGGEKVKYTEGIYVGYRYYDTKRKKVLFPFGYGLSYTDFAYGNLKAEARDGKIMVFVDITNTGDREGKETVQIYVGKKNSAIDRPSKELCGFIKLSIAPGETKTAAIELEPSAFMYFDEKENTYVTEKGTYQIYAGKSAEDICCETEVSLGLF
ncbi:MAG: glycoside hydrolase family 3 C-terminal domain-containing protein [Eubacteriales bacterium]|nr:glycoside hydrolase family 3 C-terminal domain-containing protein [Eubacteriales bacterium]